MKETLIELIEYTDPYCTWCWGSEPILRKIKEAYGDQVKITFKMGGLVEDISDFYDPQNKIGGPEWRKQVAEHWRDASNRHGMPVDEKIFFELGEDWRSTYPANIAYEAAKLQDEKLAQKFLRRMREGAAAERLQIHKRGIQIGLAKEVGLDAEKFEKDLESGAAEKVFYKNLKECRAKGITGFPTFEIKVAGQSKLLVGYHPFETFRKLFEQLTDGKIVENIPSLSEKNILAFINKYGKVASQEVAEVFGLDRNSAQKQLDKLAGENKIKKQPAGNDYFWLSW